MAAEWIESGFVVKGDLLLTQPRLQMIDGLLPGMRYFQTTRPDDEADRKLPIQSSNNGDESRT